MSDYFYSILFAMQKHIQQKVSFDPCWFACLHYDTAALANEENQ